MTRPWFPFGKPVDGARLRLFCFPYAGAGASVFRGWSLPGAEVWAVQYPGRETRMKEPPRVAMEALVEPLVEALPDDLPFAYFGHSLGALVAYECARRRPPRRLFASASRAPHLPKAGRPLRDLPEPEFLAALADLGGTPPAVLEDAELMRVYLPMLRADFTLSETYLARGHAPLDVPITAFAGRDDREVARPRVEAWREATTAPFALQAFPGDHFFLHSAQADVLAAVAEAVA